MGNKHRKDTYCHSPLRKCKLKITVRYHNTRIRILKQKILAVTAVGKNTEPLALFCIAGKVQNDTVIFKKNVKHIFTI